MLEIIGGGVAVIIAAVLLYAASKPNACRFTRSVFIAAPPQQIFPLIDDLHVMNEWNPFVKNRNVKLAYSGPERGVGAANDFEGDAQVGAGRAEIVELVEPTRVVIALRMDHPIKCRNRVEFTIAPQPNGSLVSWDMSGPQSFIGKLMSIFIDTEKMVGGAFEQGLSDLKLLVETAREEETAQ